MSKLLLSKFASAATTQLQSHFKRLESTRVNNAFCTLAPKFPVNATIMNKHELYDSFPSYVISTHSSKRFYSSSSSSSDGTPSDDEKLKEADSKKKTIGGILPKALDPFQSKSVPVVPTDKDGKGTKSKSEGKIGESNPDQIPSPACAALNHITPLDEHTVGFDLSRRRRTNPSSPNDHISPELIKPKSSKRKEQRPPKNNLDNPIIAPTTPKKSPRKKTKDRLPELNQNDCFRRHLFAIKLLLILDDQPEVLNNILWTDECNFNLPKVTPSLISKPPVAQSEMLPQIAWCGVTSKGTIGPYFFNSHVTEKSYLRMLEQYVLPELEKKGYDLKELWFQQDGAPWHRSKAVLDFLKSVFDYRVISLGTPFIWPPHSQDLTPMDYFIWDYLKVRLNFKHSKYDLCFQKGFREILTQEVASIDSNTLQSAIYGLHERLEMCVSMNGQRFAHLFFPTVSPGMTAAKEAEAQRNESSPGTNTKEEAPTIPAIPKHALHPYSLLQTKLTDYYAKLPTPDITLDKTDPKILTPEEISTNENENENNDGPNKEAK